MRSMSRPNLQRQVASLAKGGGVRIVQGGRVCSARGSDSGTSPRMARSPKEPPPRLPYCIPAIMNRSHDCHASPRRAHGLAARHLCGSPGWHGVPATSARRRCCNAARAGREAAGAALHRAHCCIGCRAE
jgi:hypothetical protein